MKPIIKKQNRFCKISWIRLKPVYEVMIPANTEGVIGDFTIICQCDTLAEAKQKANEYKTGGQNNGK